MVCRLDIIHSMLSHSLLTSQSHNSLFPSQCFALLKLGLRFDFEVVAVVVDSHADGIFIFISISISISISILILNFNNRDLIKAWNAHVNMLHDPIFTHHLNKQHSG